MLREVRLCAGEIIRKQLFCNVSRIFMFVEVLKTVAAAYSKCGRIKVF